MSLRALVLHATPTGEDLVIVECPPVRERRRRCWYAAPSACIGPRRRSQHKNKPKGENTFLFRRPKGQGEAHFPRPPAEAQNSPPLATRTRGSDSCDSRGPRRGDSEPQLRNWLPAGRINDMISRIH
jgi:hypothetical protein